MHAHQQMLAILDTTTGEVTEKSVEFILTMTLDQACQLVRPFKRVTSSAVLIFVSQPGRARSYAPTIFFRIFNLDDHNLAKWFCFEDCQSKLFTPTRVFMLTGLSVSKYFL
jgi:hypothetical protein